MPVNSDSPYYDISTMGELALVEGDELRIYAIKPQPSSGPANKAISEQR